MQQRNNTTLVKRIVDICLTLLLLCLMAYQVTGEALHEWFGIGMTFILIIHHILNRKWYGALLKGKYNLLRIITTVVNTLLLASIALTAFCGMSMSNHAVPFLYGMTDMIFARAMHLAMSYWSLILMGLHLGFHLPVMTAKVRPGRSMRWICPLLLTELAVIGLWMLIRNGIPKYITFRTHFAFFDYEKSWIVVFLENMSELFFFVFIGANIVRLIHSLNSKRNRNKNLQL